MRRFAALFLVLGVVIMVRPAFAESSEDSVRDVLMKLGQSLSANDNDATAQCFSDNAVFVDSTGDATTGRANIATRLHCNDTGTKYVLHPEAIRQLSPDTAFAIGQVSRDRNGIAIPSSRFTANLSKTGSTWQIQTATETALKTTAADNIAELKWLEGKWTSGQKKLSAEFLPNKNFLQLKLQDGESTGADTCILGWDAAAQSLQSWQFNNDGGFSSSTWTRRGTDWLVDATGVSADGDRTRALGLLTPLSDDEFTWTTSRISGAVFGGGNKQLITWKRSK